MLARHRMHRREDRERRGPEWRKAKQERAEREDAREQPRQKSKNIRAIKLHFRSARIKKYIFSLS